MNTTASVHIVGDPKLADRSIVRLHELERRWSRFIATSELSLLNQAGGRATTVSSDMVALVEAMVAGWYMTDGAFDPTLLRPLVGLGYGSSRSDPAMKTAIPRSTKSQGDPSQILVDRERNVVQLPPGTVLDPGGIGKGLAADIVCAESMRDGATGALVEVGGDIRVAGESCAESSGVNSAWTVEICKPDRSPSSHSVGLISGAVATSSSRLRQWDADGVVRHHLLDPSTLQPTTNEVIGCTVVAGTAAHAEVLTKVAFVRPVDHSLKRFDELGLAALITTSSGIEHLTAAWSEFVR